MKKLFIVNLLSILIGCHLSTNDSISTYYSCTNNNLIIVSNTVLDNDDMYRVCNCYETGIDYFYKNYFKSSYDNIIVYYLTPDHYYRTGAVSDYAYCQGNKIYIKVYNPWFGKPEINRRHPTDKYDLHHLFFHELYHILAYDTNENNANNFAWDVPEC